VAKGLGKRVKAVYWIESHRFLLLVLDLGYKVGFIYKFILGKQDVMNNG
jgi:hypothetical protein